jgi:hypothetical protein
MTLARRLTSQYLPKLHKRARHLILDCCDLVGFLAEDLRIATDDGGFRERVRATSSVSADFNITDITQYWKG